MNELEEPDPSPEFEVGFNFSTAELYTEHIDVLLHKIISQAVSEGLAEIDQDLDPEEEARNHAECFTVVISLSGISRRGESHEAITVLDYVRRSNWLARGIRAIRKNGSSTKPLVQVVDLFKEAMIYSLNGQSRELMLGIFGKMLVRMNLEIGDEDNNDGSPSDQTSFTLDDRTVSNAFATDRFGLLKLEITVVRDQDYFSFGHHWPGLPLLVGGTVLTPDERAKLWATE